MYGDQAAGILVNSLSTKAKVLDVGAGKDGNGLGCMIRYHGHEYTTFDVAKDKVRWEELNIRPSWLSSFDAVAMCHSLEHMLDTHTALKQVTRVLKHDGILCVTVPPAKHEIVGGHVTLWNAGLLLYRLILAGFDCSKAAVKAYGYNVSVVTRYVPILDMPELKYDSGDIRALSKYFPLPTQEGFYGEVAPVNWGPV